jgi:hypothetical protein
MKIISENKRKVAAVEAQKMILESFAETFNKIKRNSDSKIITEENKLKQLNENYSSNIESLKSDLENSYYNISKKIESFISELSLDMDKNQDVVYKLETLMSETQKLSNYVSEIGDMGITIYENGKIKL